MLVVRGRQAFEAVQLGVAEEFPPGAARQVRGGLGRLPDAGVGGRRAGEGRGHGVGAQRRGPLVIRADGAAGEQQGEEGKTEGRNPKAEGRPKSEGRRANARSQESCRAWGLSAWASNIATPTFSIIGASGSGRIRLRISVGFEFGMSDFILTITRERIGALRWRRQALTRCAQALKGQIDHRRGVKGQGLREHQAADDRDAQRLAQLRAGAHADGQRHRRRTARPSWSS